MRTYFDPSVLIALYLPEPLSGQARAAVGAYGQPLLLNQLQELEFRNGLRQKVCRGEITETQAAKCLRIFDDDCVQGRIQRKPVFWDQVYEKAEDISGRFALRLPCRAFDLLHVAVAVLSEVNRFASFDQDQGKVARAVGLEWVSFVA